MLTANNDQGGLVYADGASRDFDYFCPECESVLILKQGRVNIAHFAHPPSSDCALASPESLRHMEMKSGIFRAVSRADYSLAAYVEKQIGNRRADIAIETSDGGVVIECQASSISVDEVEQRMLDYNAEGYAVMWVWDNSLLKPNPRYGSWEYNFRNHGSYRFPYSIIAVNDLAPGWGVLIYSSKVRRVILRKRRNRETMYFLSCYDLNPWQLIIDYFILQEPELLMPGVYQMATFNNRGLKQERFTDGRECVGVAPKIEATTGEVEAFAIFELGAEIVLDD